MPPPDLFRRLEGAAPVLPAEEAAALLQPDLVRAGSGRRASILVDASVLERVGRLVLRPEPMDKATVSVSKPVVADEAGEFVAGVLFRRASHVVPSAAGDGEATFGEERAEDHLHWYEPPLPGARAELTFSPPRRNARYLLELWCSGASISVRGTDGTALQSTGSFSIVYVAPGTVTYTIDSAEYWWFRRCAIRWLAP